MKEEKEEEEEKEKEDDVGFALFCSCRKVFLRALISLTVEENLI